MYILIGTLVLSIHNTIHTNSLVAEFNTIEACNTAITQIHNYTNHIDLEKSSFICLSKDDAKYVNTTPKKTSLLEDL